ncbi:MAG: flagellar motor switch protein FliN [Thiobacillus sp.]
MSEETLADVAEATEPTMEAAETSAVAVADNVALPQFRQFSGGATGEAKNDIDMILDIPVKLTVEIGRTKIAIKNLLQLAQGSVLELDNAAGEPLDVLVNGCLIARGEAVMVNDKLGIRLTGIISPAERLRKLNP